MAPVVVVGGQPGAARPPVKGIPCCGAAPFPERCSKHPPNVAGGSGVCSRVELRKQEAVAGGINNGGCFVIGEAFAVTRTADGICRLVANRGGPSTLAHPDKDGAEAVSQENPKSLSQENPNPQPGRVTH